MMKSNNFIIGIILIGIVAVGGWWWFSKPENPPNINNNQNNVVNTGDVFNANNNQTKPIKKVTWADQREAQKQKEQQEREEQERQKESQKTLIKQEDFDKRVNFFINIKDEKATPSDFSLNDKEQKLLIKYIRKNQTIIPQNNEINEEQKKIDAFNNQIKDITDQKRLLQIQYDKSTPEFERLQLKDDNDTLTSTEKNKYNKLFNERTQLEIDISKLQNEYEGLQEIIRHTDILKKHFEYKRDQYISLNKNALIDDLKQYYRLQEEEPTKPMSELDAYEKETAEVETSIPQEYKVKINNAVETLTKVEDINQLDQYQDVFCMNVTRIKDVVKERINAINACKTEAEKDEARKAYKIILKNELTIECDEEKPWQPSK